jgi:uncharacterized SAM-binding protein YcdF (DUF218 family)
LIYIRQIVPALFSPLGACIMLALAGLILRRRWLVGLSIALLWVTSTPLVSAPIMRATEGWAQRVPETAAPTADAIVVLSTGRLVAPGPARISEWDDADRFFGGVELFRAKKAPLLVFTGAWSPWAPAAPLEGDVLSTYAKAFGVPAEHIRSTGRVLTTEDEAREVAALLRRAGAGDRVLLVTSAFHMTRARRLFERAGTVVLPFPVDFKQPEGTGFDLTSVVPNARSAVQTQLAVHELYGRLYYRLAHTGPIH